MFERTSTGIFMPDSHGLLDLPHEVNEEHWSHLGRVGDLKVELRFGNYLDRHRREAALVMWASNPRRVATVPLSQLYMIEEMASGAEMLHTMAAALAEQIYGMVIKKNVERVIDACVNFADDLRKSPLPPRSPRLTKQQWLEQVDRELEGGHMFVEVNGDRMKLGG